MGRRHERFCMKHMQPPAGFSARRLAPKRMPTIAITSTSTWHPANLRRFATKAGYAPRRTILLSSRASLFGETRDPAIRHPRWVPARHCVPSGMTIRALAFDLAASSGVHFPARPAITTTSLPHCITGSSVNQCLIQHTEGHLCPLVRARHLKFLTTIKQPRRAAAFQRSACAATARPRGAAVSLPNIACRQAI